MIKIIITSLNIVNHIDYYLILLYSVLYYDLDMIDNGDQT